MGENDQRVRFDEIVAHLTTGDPELRRLAREAPRPLAVVTRAALLVAAAVIWALLSVSMVAWGWPGVLLTVLIVAGAGGVAATDRFRLWWVQATGRRRS